MTQGDTEALLAPHLTAIRSAIEGGWKAWHEWQKTKPDPIVLSGRTRASTVYDLVAARLDTYFASVGITTVWKTQFLHVVFPGEKPVILRFKKFLDRRLRTSGIPTEQRLAVDAQQHTFDGMEATWIVAGYIPDSTGLELEKIAISCSYYGDLQWSIDLDEDAESGAIAEPIHPVAPAPPAVRSTRPAAKKKSIEEQ